MSGYAAVRGRYGRQTASGTAVWAKDYLRRAALADFGCAIIAVFAAVQLRFGDHVKVTYVALSLALPLLWLGAIGLAGGYDVRFIGTGSDEFRKILNAGVGLTAAVAIFSYVVNVELSRGYVLIALPSVTVCDLFARYAIRKRLHRWRDAGRCLLSVVVVGHEAAVTNLITVRPDLGASSVVELIALARKNPGKVTYGSQGNGSTPHLNGELFKTMAHIDIVHVPYRGTGPAMNDLIAGQVDMMFHDEARIGGAIVVNADGKNGEIALLVVER